MLLNCGNMSRRRITNTTALLNLRSDVLFVCVFVFVLLRLRVLSRACKRSWY